jgi:hypothetical protein
MTAPADESDSDATAAEPLDYRGVSIERSVAGRIGTPPGRPLYLYSCVVYGRRLARTSITDLERAIDEALGT